MTPNFISRRKFAKLSVAAGLISILVPSHSKSNVNGKLLIIGGAEDRQNELIILKKFIELSGGDQAKLKFILAASSEPSSVWSSYSNVFNNLGATNVEPIALLSREDAYNPSVVSNLLAADGIFITGGDQSRLMTELWETPAFRAIHQVFYLNGICIAGTSAGAAVMSRQMIAQGQAPIITQKDVVSFDIGLGLVSMAIIDQHFSQRRRLARLLSALAQRPDLLGVGIDENTGLVITINESIEVIGAGAVTILDGREMISNYDEIEAQEKLELLGVKMHLLPSGSSYYVNANRTEEKRLASLLNAIKYLVLPGPARF
jgi:cyanophycinase